MSDPAASAFARMQGFAAGSGGRTSRDFHFVGTAAVAEVEEKLRCWYGARYAVCVSNATDALGAIAVALRLRDREFVTTPLTWGGSIAEWLRLGNRPRFAALDPHTLTLSPQSVRKAITPKTKAILAVDMFGNPADMRGLRAIADEYTLWLISDASQSLGAKRGGVPASATADAWVISFGIGKGIDAGDGGSVITDNHDLYQKVVWETQHPSRQRIALAIDLENEFATNSRMNPWTAIWLAETFDAQLAIVRQRLAEITQYLSTPRLTQLATTPVADPSIEPSFHRVVGRVQDAQQVHEFLRVLEEDGWRAVAEPLDRRLLFEQPAFLAQYARRASGVLGRSSLGINLADYFCLALERAGDML